MVFRMKLTLVDIRAIGLLASLGALLLLARSGSLLSGILLLGGLGGGGGGLGGGLLVSGLGSHFEGCGVGRIREKKAKIARLRIRVSDETCGQRVVMESG